MAWGAKDDGRIVEVIRELFSEQTRLISDYGKTLSQQQSAVESLSKQVSSIQNELVASRQIADQRWESLPHLYVPRQETLSINLEGRVAGLEQFRMSSTEDLAEMRSSMQQQITSAVQAASSEIAKAQLAMKTELSDNRASIDGRTLTLVVSAALSAISLITSFALHFMH